VRIGQTGAAEGVSLVVVWEAAIVVSLGQCCVSQLNPPHAHRGGHLLPQPGTLTPSRPRRTTNAIERLHEEFKQRIKMQTVLPWAETAAMLLWALLASDQISMHKVDGWQTLAQPPAQSPFGKPS
jgi:hypothetical protein